jgi:hypothetical protein
MNFTLQTKSGDKPVTLSYHNLFAIGYAGRNTEKTMAHIKELEEELGVAPPKKIPTIFQCSNLLLSQDKTMHMVGDKTSGEVEYVVLLDGDKIYIGVGSDHTDRALEKVSVLKSKQVCPKPIGPTLWDYEEIKGHFDDIAIQSWQVIGGQKVIYQDGKLSDIMPPEKTLPELKSRVGDIGNAVVFSGTVPLKDGFKYGQTFIGQLKDEVLGRTITCEYNIISVTEEER